MQLLPLRDRLMKARQYRSAWPQNSARKFTVIKLNIYSCWTYTIPDEKQRKVV